jgi:tetratricopeptide (TPR) repeat protein
MGVTKRQVPFGGGNALRTSEEGVQGLYLFLPDAIVVLGPHGEVEKHEVAHRFYAQYIMRDSSFETLRQLVGISYTLLSVLHGLANGEWWLAAQANRAFRIEGMKLGNLHVIGTSERAEAVRTVIQRLEYIENLVDMAWRTLEPISELGAIDFAEGVGKRGLNWNLIRSEPSGSSRKRDLVEAVIAQYPKEFGGYYTSYGSFQDAMRQVWEAYDQIENDQARHELLSLAMTVIYLDSGNVVKIADPISVILNNATFAREAGVRASEAFSARSHELRKKADQLIDWVELLLEDVPDEYHEARRFADAVSRLSHRQWEYGGWGRGLLPMGLSPMYLTDDANSLEASFLRFKVGADDRAYAYVNPAFLIAPMHELRDDVGLDDLPLDWWQQLLFLEELRQAIKIGRPLSCPFNGWLSNLPCRSNCTIGQRIHNLGYWPEITAEFSRCEADDSVPSEDEGFIRGMAARLSNKEDSGKEETKRSPQSRIKTNLGVYLQEKNRQDDALQAFSRAIELDPANETALLRRGDLYRRLGESKYLEAIADYSQVLSLTPGLREALAGRGLVYELLRDYQKAFNDYSAILMHNSEDIWALMRRGRICIELHDYQQAAKDLELALAVRSTHKGKILPGPSLISNEDDLQEYNETIDRFKGTISEDGRSYVFRGEYLYNQGKYAEALADFSGAVPLLIESVQLFERSDTPSLGMHGVQLAYLRGALIGKALACIELGQVEPALDALGKALIVAPNDQFALITRAEVHGYSGNYEDAIADLSRIIKLRPGYSWAHLQRAEMYMALNDPQAAQTDFAEAVIADPGRLECLQLLVIAYANLGRGEDALHSLDTILRYQPNNSWALETRLKLLPSGPPTE